MSGGGSSAGWVDGKVNGGGLEVVGAGEYEGGASAQA